MARKRPKEIVLDPFTGRGTTLNRAIIYVLGKKEPQTTRAMHKGITQIKTLKDTSYSTVNKRVRDLEQKGYVKKVAVKERLGGIANYYELTPKAYLAKFFDSTSIQELVKKVDDETAMVLLGTLVGADYRQDINND